MNQHIMPTTSLTVTPLLWAIRENVGLTGTKYGCGIAQFCACTVHIDGVAMRSCGVTVSGSGREKTYWQQAIEAFERLVHARIGHILLRFMDLQRRLAEMQAKLTRKFADQDHFEKQQKSYFDFKEKVEQDTLFTDALPNLDASKEKELKSLYREALFMAHPDHSMTMRQKKPGLIRSPQPSRRPTGKKT